MEFGSAERKDASDHNCLIHGRNLNFDLEAASQTRRSTPPKHRGALWWAALRCLQAKWDLKQVVHPNQSQPERGDGWSPATRPNAIVGCHHRNGSRVWLNQVCLAAERQAYFHQSPWRSGESEQVSEGMHSPEHTHTHTHTHTYKHWHLIEDPSTAKALYSPQLAPSSDAHPKPSSNEPNTRFCFKEALMTCVCSSSDMAFGCLTLHFVLLWTLTIKDWTSGARSHK